MIEFTIYTPEKPNAMTQKCKELTHLQIRKSWTAHIRRTQEEKGGKTTRRGKGGKQGMQGRQYCGAGEKVRLGLQLICVFFVQLPVATCSRWLHG